MNAQSLSHVRLFATPWTTARQNSLSTEFPRQEYWSGLPFPTPGDLPDPGIDPEAPASPAWQVDSLPLHHKFTQKLYQADSLPSESPGKANTINA